MNLQNEYRSNKYTNCLIDSKSVHSIYRLCSHNCPECMKWDSNSAFSIFKQISNVFWIWSIVLVNVGKKSTEICHVPVACLPSRSTQRCSKAWLCSWRELGFCVLTNWISSSLNSSSLASSKVIKQRMKIYKILTHILSVFLLENGYPYVTFSTIPPVMFTNTSVPLQTKCTIYRFPLNWKQKVIALFYSLPVQLKPRRSAMIANVSSFLSASSCQSTKKCRQSHTLNLSNMVNSSMCKIPLTIDLKRLSHCRYQSCKIYVGYKCRFKFYFLYLFYCMLWAVILWK